MKNLVVKSNELNKFTLYKSITHSKIFSKIILEIRKEQEQNIYRFLISDLIEEFDFGKKHYGELKQICQKMMVSIDISQDKEFDLNVLFLRIDTKEKGYVSFEVNPRLKNYILNQTKNFTSYFLENIANLKSAYSFRIYELLKQYQSKDGGWFKTEVKTLRERLGISEKQYKLYGHFKDKVLNVAQKELKAKTDLCFDFEEIKRVRKVEIIVFHIKANQKIIKELKQRKIKDESIFKSEPANKVLDNKPKLKKTQPNFKDTKIYNFLIKEFNLDDAFIKEIFSKYDKDRLKRNFNYVVKKIKNDEIKSNIGGFLRKALEGDFANHKSLDDIKQEKREAIKQKEIKEQQDQQIISNLTKLYNKHNQEQLFEYLENNKLDLKQEFKTFIKEKKAPNFMTNETKETIKKEYQEAIQEISNKGSNALFRIYLFKYLDLESFEAFSKKQGYILSKEQDLAGTEQYIIKNIIKNQEAKQVTQQEKNQELKNKPKEKQGKAREKKKSKKQQQETTQPSFNFFKKIL